MNGSASDNTSRIEKLESQVRRTRFLVFTLVAAGLVLSLLGTTGSPDQFEARQLSIVDDQGRVRVQIGLANVEGILRSSDAEEEKVVIVDSAIRILEEDQKLRVLFGAGAKATAGYFAGIGHRVSSVGMRILDTNGETRGYLESDGTGAKVWGSRLSASESSCIQSNSDNRTCFVRDAFAFVNGDGVASCPRVLDSEAEEHAAEKPGDSSRDSGQDRLRWCRC